MSTIWDELDNELKRLEESAASYRRKALDEGDIEDATWHGAQNLAFQDARKELNRLRGIYGAR